MVKLQQKAPVVSLPITHGRASIDLLDQGRVTSIAPYPGREMRAQLGGPFPAPGEVRSFGAGRIVWAGRDLVFLMDVDPPAGLAEVAALTDQTDGWVWVHLTGADARAVLARLTPLDLRSGGFAIGTSARTMLNHMQAILIRPAPEAFEIAVFRSMAGTLVHELQEAMRSVAARARM